MPTCKLCECVTDKLAKSHIIPRSLYGDTLNDPSGNAKLLTNRPDWHPKRMPVGSYDSGILCAECEASLSDVDSYAHEIFMRREPLEVVDFGKLSLAIDFGHIDKERLLLFFITLLWRMEVTNCFGFHPVKVGKYYAALREATRRLNPKFVPEIDVVVQRFDERNTAVLYPTRHRLAGVNCYRIGFSGYSAFVKLDRRQFQSNLASLTLRSPSPLRMLYVKYRDSPECHAAIETLRYHTTKSPSFV